MTAHRTAFFISDRTGVTAEMLGQSLLSQFDGVDFRRVTVPFVDSIPALTGLVLVASVRKVRRAQLRQAAETIHTQNVSLEQANRLLKERSTAAMESLSATVDARDALRRNRAREGRERAARAGAQRLDRAVALPQLVEGAGAGVGAGRAHPGADAVEQVDVLVETSC